MTARTTSAAARSTPVTGRFEFKDENTATGELAVRIVFTLTPREPATAPAKFPDFDDDFFYDQVSPQIDARELETRFGVHDFEAAAGTFLGFTSYEIADWEGLAAEWEAILRDLGFEVTRVI